MIEVSINVQGAQVAFAKLKSNIQNHPVILGQIAWRYAKYMTSKYKNPSGAMRAARKILYPEGKVILRQAMPRHRDGRDRPYHLWHHGYGKYNLMRGKYAPKIARPDFMYYSGEKTLEWAKQNTSLELVKGV